MRSKEKRIFYSGIVISILSMGLLVYNLMISHISYIGQEVLYSILPYKICTATTILSSLYATIFAISFIIGLTLISSVSDIKTPNTSIINTETVGQLATPDIRE